MSPKRNWSTACLGVLAAVIASGVSLAALLGNTLLFPQIFFVGGTTKINFDGQMSQSTLTVNTEPTHLRDPSIAYGIPQPITEVDESTPRSFDISIVLDSSCSLIGGDSGDDLVVRGTVNLDPYGAGDIRSGTLLTGEVLEFGYENGTTIDAFDFRFSVTGGLLADLYVNEDLGVEVSEATILPGFDPFDGNCGESTVNGAKGTLGSIAPILPADGCTPGYWKQKHHFDSWVDFAPTDTFSSVFGRDLTSLGITSLEDALEAKGGGAKALARHATASLLNASSPDVNAESNYDTTAEVVAAFQAAYDSGDYEPTKDAFEQNNEAGCPLN